MDMSAYMECLKNTALKNPIVEATTGLLSKLDSIPTVGLTPDALASLEKVKEDLQKQADESVNLVSGIKDSLPLLKASDAMSSKMKIMKGVTPSIEGGDLIKGITGTIGDLTTKAASFASDIGSQVDALAGAGAAAIESFVSDLSTAAATHMEETATAFSGVTDGISGAITDLKDYAFAKFSSMPQPPALTELMASILPDTCQAPKAEVVKSEEEIAREVVEKKYEEAIEPPTPTATDLFEKEVVPVATNTEDIPAPVVNGKTPQELKDSVYAQIDSLYDRRKALAIETTQLLVQTRNKKYELYPDYDEVKKQAFEGNLAAKNKYDKMLAEMERIPPFTTWVEKHAEYDKCEEEITRLQKLLKSWAMNNYESVPNGPPW